MQTPRHDFQNISVPGQLEDIKVVSKRGHPGGILKSLEDILKACSCPGSEFQGVGRPLLMHLWEVPQGILCYLWLKCNPPVVDLLMAVLSLFSSSAHLSNGTTFLPSELQVSELQEAPVVRVPLKCVCVWPTNACVCLLSWAHGLCFAAGPVTCDLNSVSMTSLGKLTLPLLPCLQTESTSSRYSSESPHWPFRETL